MDYDTFNLSVRKFLKTVGVSSQREIEQAARAAGAQEAWMVEDGFVTEGASYTAFILTDDGIVTRPYSQAVLAGCTGAAASQFWFLAFALTAAANVRTLALIEVLFAQAISFFVFKQRTTAREALGMSLIVAGVVLLIWAQ